MLLWSGTLPLDRKEIVHQIQKNEKVGEIY